MWILSYHRLFDCSVRSMPGGQQWMKTWTCKAGIRLSKSDDTLTSKINLECNAFGAKTIILLMDEKTAKQLVGRISQCCCYPIYVYYIISQLVSQILNHQAFVTTWESKHYIDISLFDVKQAGNMPSSPKLNQHSKWETNIRTTFKGTKNLHLYGGCPIFTLRVYQKKTTNKRQNKTNIFSKNARLFNVTFLFPRFRSLNLYKRHSTIPKRSEILAKYQVFVKHKLITFFLVGGFNLLEKYWSNSSTFPGVPNDS